jgi:ATP-dependent DNA helicase RecG
MLENSAIDKKSLRVVAVDRPDWDELAKDCVAFANAAGGKLLIGIEDDADQPPSSQRVHDSWLDALNRKITERTINVGIAPRKLVADNGGEYIQVTVFRNAQTIAARSDGKYFIRVADQSRPVLPDELGRLVVDRNAFVWEAQPVRKVPRRQFDPAKLRRFVETIRASDRVSQFVKEKSDDELLDHYVFASGDHLTNLGVLWIGRREDRAVLLYAPVVQFIKYDETERKANKIVWDDFSLNPMELIEAVWREVPDWKESTEVADGLFRRNIPNYEEVVVRELVANALVHRPYTMRGDIFINLYTDRLEVHNPGLLPLGVTPENILHTSVRRNELLTKVCYDLKLMEREGSGYERMYEALLVDGKGVPEVREGSDRVTVVVRKRVVRPEVVQFIDRANQTYVLRQKELISLGLIAQHGSLPALEFSKTLELTEPHSVRHWLGRLPDWKLVQSRGRTRATEYYVNLEVLRKLAFGGRTDLKGIEAHRLRALITEDLRICKRASISQIHGRIGKEIPRRKIRHQLSALIQAGTVRMEGQKRGAVYVLTE